MESNNYIDTVLQISLFLISKCDTHFLGGKGCWLLFYTYFSYLLCYKCEKRPALLLSTIYIYIYIYTYIEWIILVRVKLHFHLIIF